RPSVYRWWRRHLGSCPRVDANATSARRALEVRADPHKPHSETQVARPESAFPGHGERVLLRSWHCSNRLYHPEREMERKSTTQKWQRNQVISQFAESLAGASG